MADENVKGIRIDLTLTARGVSDKLRDIRKNVRELQTDLRTLDRISKLDPSNLDTYAKKLETTQRLYERQTSLVQTYQNKLADLHNKMSSTAADIEKLSNSGDGNEKKLSDLKEKQKSYANQIEVTTKNLEKAKLSQVEYSEKVNATKKEIEQLTAAEKENAEALKIKNIRDSISSLQDELKILERISKLNPGNMDTYAKKLETTQKLYEKQNQLVDAYKEKLTNLKSAIDSNANAIQEMTSSGSGNARELANLKEKQESYKQQLSETTRNLDKAKLTQTEYGEKVNATKKEIDDLTNSQKDNSAALEEANQNISAFDVALGELTVRAIEKTIDACKNLVSSIYETGTSFEDTTNGLAAILQQSSDSQEIQDLSSYFQELAENSKYSADEITSNAQVLANAGYNADQIKTSISTIDNLAIGTGEDFSTMANVVTDGLHAFGLSAEDASYFANVLAKTAISSNTNVSQLGEAFQYAGSIAGAYGYKIEDVGVALGAMASSGIKATIAGTSFRQIVTRMAAPVAESQEAMDALGLSFYDTNGKARPLMDVLNELRSKLRGLSDEEKATYEKQLAGQRGLTGLSAIINMSEEDWSALTAEVKNYNGTVDQMANTRLDSVSGDVDEMKNAWKNFSSEMFEEVEPSLRNLIQTATELEKKPFFKKELLSQAKSFSKILDGISKVLENVDSDTIKTTKNILKIATTLGVVTKASNSALPKIGKVGTTIIGIGESIKKSNAGVITSIDDTASAGKTLSGFVSSLASGANVGKISLVAGAVAAVGTAIYEAGQEAKEEKEHFYDVRYGLNSMQQSAIDATNSMNDAFNEVQEAADENDAAIEAEYGQYDDLIAEYDSLIDSNGNVKEGYEERADVILTTLANAVGVEKQQLQDEITAQGDLQSAIQGTIDKMKAEAYLEAHTEEYTEAIKNQKSNTEELAKTYGDLSDAVSVASQKYSDLNDAQTALEDYEAKFGTSSYSAEWRELSRAVTDAQTAYDTAQQKADDLSAYYESLSQNAAKYNQTISNYENLQEAMVEGNHDKIVAAIDDISSTVLTAGTTTVGHLQSQYRDAQQALDDALQAQKDGVSWASDDVIAQLTATRDEAKAQYEGAIGDVTPLMQQMEDSARQHTTNTTDMYRYMLNEALSKHREAVSNYTQLMEESKDASNGITQDQIDNAKSAVDQTAYMVSQCRDNVQQAEKDAATSGGNYTSNYGNAMMKKIPFAVSVSRDLSSKSKAQLKIDTVPSGQFFGQGFIDGINSKLQLAISTARGFASKALDAFRNTGGEGSPWKTTIQSGQWFDEGFANGITDKAYLAQRAAEKLTDDTLGTFSQMPYNMASIGVDSVSKMSESMYGAKAKLSKIAQRTVNNMANSKLDMSVDYTGNSNVVGAVTALQTEVSSLQTSMNGVIDSLSNQNREFSFEIPFDINGRQFAKATATYTENELNRRQKQKERRNGNR